MVTNLRLSVLAFAAACTSLIAADAPVDTFHKTQATADGGLARFDSQNPFCGAEKVANIAPRFIGNKFNIDGELLGTRRCTGGVRKIRNLSLVRLDSDQILSLIVNTEISVEDTVTGIRMIRPYEIYGKNGYFYFMESDSDARGSYEVRDGIIMIKALHYYTGVTKNRYIYKYNNEYFFVPSNLKRIDLSTLRFKIVILRKQGEASILRSIPKL